MKIRVGNLVRILLLITVALITIRGTIAKYVIKEVDRLTVEVEYLKKTFNDEGGTFEFQEKLSELKSDLQIVTMLEAVGPYITFLVVMCLMSTVGCIFYLYTLYL